MTFIFQANLNGPPSESFQSFQRSPLLGYQLRLIPTFVLLKIKWPPKILRSTPPAINNDGSLRRKKVVVVKRFKEASMNGLSVGWPLMEIRLYKKGVPFLSEIVYKMVRGWTGGRNSPYKTLLSVPTPIKWGFSMERRWKSQSIIMQTVDTETLKGLCQGSPLHFV